ncbi:DUF4931 domain-containing protein [Candidatus Woesearchaeota archaeon]|nr:DUF4931 domain-containing protein [Candidatus Woesearchaeota archaeon]
MIELRKDYVLDRWVILAPSRKKRPRDFVRQPAAVSAGSNVCAFCRGNEKLTPPEIGRINSPDSSGDWSMRWFPNLFPAVEESGQREVRTDNTFYTFSAAYGSHEIIVETPFHDRQLWDFSDKEVRQLLQVYCDRIADLGKRNSIKYVAVFKNHGIEGGASLAHSHSQIMSTNILPSLIREETAAMKNYKSCPYCSIINSEKNSYRRCFENDHAVAFTPYASRFNFEIWIFPKRHFRQLSGATQEELAGISRLLQQALAKLKELNAPYNYVLHYLPVAEDGDFHFHIEMQPRFSIWAGFELTTDIIINSVAPEDAAKFYRGED